MELIFSGDNAPAKKIVDQMTAAAAAVLSIENVRPDDIEISVSFVDMDEIRELNRNFRDIDKTTDVLSFPQFEDKMQIPDEGVVSLGDVVICTEQAMLQADDFGHSAEREIVYLFTHSLFHLLGYDHMNEMDKDEMRHAEEKVMAMTGLERRD